MRNVAITLDDETASWVRVYAAGLRLSVSRFVGEVLKEVTHSPARAAAQAAPRCQGDLAAAVLATLALTVSARLRPHPAR